MDERALRQFFAEVTAAHPVRCEAATGAYVCRCGLLAKFCQVHRAAVRNRLYGPTAWQPLPEDVIPACDEETPPPARA